MNTIADYLENPINIDDYSIKGFCNGWKKPLSENQLKEIIKNSAYVVIAVNGESVIGIITALCDYVNWAFIPYLEVKEEYKGKGIGTELMTRILRKLKDINCIDLTCDIEMQNFYEKFEMLKSNGMVIRKYFKELQENSNL